MSDAPTSDFSGWRKAPFAGAGLTYDCYEKGEVRQQHGHPALAARERIVAFLRERLSA